MNREKTERVVFAEHNDIDDEVQIIKLMKTEEPEASEKILER